MKGFVIVAVFALIVACKALSDEEKTKMRELYTECVKATKANEDLIKKLRAGEDIKDEGVKKYIGCMSKKLGFVVDGKVDVEKLKSKIPSDFDKEEAHKIIDQCKDSKADTDDDTSFLLYRCFLDKTSKFLSF